MEEPSGQHSCTASNVLGIRSHVPLHSTSLNSPQVNLWANNFQSWNTPDGSGLGTDIDWGKPTDSWGNYCSWVSWPWHLIHPSPLCLITSMRLLPVILYVAMFPDYLYSLCIVTNRWALCLVCLPIQLLNVFPFTILVTYHSRPDILTNTICLGELATSITKLTHCAARTVLIIGLPDPLSIAPYILQ